MTGLVASFGSGAMTNSIADLGQADTILVVGSNTTEAHPIVGIELTRAAMRGTRVIVVDPRRIRLVDHAEHWLRIQPGTNVALINAMMRIILDEGLADEDFIEERTEGFGELRRVLEEVHRQREREKIHVLDVGHRHVRRAGGTGRQRVDVVERLG